MLEGLAKYHVLADGNKRTALAISARLLYMNGYRLTATNKELEIFAVSVVVDDLGVAEITDWLRTHTVEY